MNAVMDQSRVLVVDDEPQITRVLKTVLTSHGYHVRTAAEGESALSSLDEWHPELVITDLYMPRMDGVELCRRIRAVSSVPIIVLSVKGEERSKVEALDSGADDYVTKPFGTDELLARVRAALRRAGPVSEVGSFEVGSFRIDLDARRVHVRGNEVRLTPKEFDLFVVHGASSESSADSSHSAGGGVGWRVAGAAGIPASVHGPTAQEAGSRPVESQVFGDGAVGRLSVQSARVIEGGKGR